MDIYQSENIRGYVAIFVNIFIIKELDINIKYRGYLQHFVLLIFVKYKNVIYLVQYEHQY